MISNAQRFINLTVLNKTFLQGEDFSLFCEKFPSLYLLYGIGEQNYLHTSNFNFDEDILYSCLNKVISLLSLY